MTNTDVARVRASAARSLGGFLGIAVQLGVLLLLLRWLQIEPSSGLPRILPLIFVGFVAHAALPLRYRAAFFVVLTWAAMVLVLGPGPGVLLIALGIAVVFLSHLPVAFSTRIVLLLGLGGALTALRGGWAPGWMTPVAGPTRLVLPVLGSMFMFRLIIYLYDLRHEERRAAAGSARGPADGASWWTRLGYFFLLPNAVFWLFPVVDWRTYRRTYYDEDALRIYQRGLWWMSLGIVHLLLYRVVYHYMVPAPEQVQGVAGVVRFMTSSYLIYLRVSGLFHLITGILCLFGFNLPPFHRWFFLASGFTDFWRRARIDWKDFMVKVFYFPAFVPLQRRLGLMAAMVPATVAVFVVTWLLHSWQWFWLRGDFRLSGADGVFWTAFGVCVLANSLLEARSRRKARAGWSLGPAIGHALKVLGMFAFLSVLWSYWSSPSAAIWWSLVKAAGESGPGAWAVLLGVLAAVVALGVLAQYMTARRNAVAAAEQGAPFARPAPAAGEAARRPLWGWRPAVVAAVTALLLLVGIPAGRGSLGEPAARLAGTLGSDHLNAVDQEREDRGYYEELLDTPRSSIALAAAPIADFNEAPPLVEKPPADDRSEARRARRAAREARGTEGADGPLASQPFVRVTKDLLGYELIESHTGSYKDASFRTNRWGMRDREYPRTPGPNTYRITLIGSSYSMGAGVPEEQGHESLLEERLNREGPSAPRMHYEILNLAVGGYGLLENLVVLERKTLSFQPRAILLMIHPDERRVINRIQSKIVAGIPIDDTELAALLRRAGVRPGMQAPELQRRLAPMRTELVRWIFERMASFSRAHDVKLIGVLLPVPNTGRRNESLSLMGALAEESGIPVLDLGDVFADHDLSSVRLSDEDPHYNATGHKLVADRLFELLRSHDGELLELGFATGGP